MNAIRIHQTGDAGVRRLETIDVPCPAPGQALGRLEAIGLNFFEIDQRTGMYKVQSPFTPGTEGAGIVEAIGPGVAAVRQGDRVASVNLLGSCAEHALAPADRLVPLPD